MTSGDIGFLDEVFTHIDEGDGHQTSYAVTALYARCLQGDIQQVRVPVDKAHADFCVAERGIEQDRLIELVAHVDYLKKPVMFVAMDDGTHLLIDGAHRYVCYFALQQPAIPAYLIPWSIAKDFIVEDLPQITKEKLMQHSGIAALRKIFGAP